MNWLHNMQPASGKLSIPEPPAFLKECLEQPTTAATRKSFTATRFSTHILAAAANLLTLDHQPSLLPADCTAAAPSPSQHLPHASKSPHPTSLISTPTLPPPSLTRVKPRCFTPPSHAPPLPPHHEGVWPPQAGWWAAGGGWGKWAASPGCWTCAPGRAECPQPRAAAPRQSGSSSCRGPG